MGSEGTRGAAAPSHSSRLCKAPPRRADACFAARPQGVYNDMALRHVPEVPPRTDTLAGPAGRRADVVGAPYLMRADDMRRVVPLWAEYTARVRNDTQVSPGAGARACVRACVCSGHGPRWLLAQRLQEAGGGCCRSCSEHGTRTHTRELCARTHARAHGGTHTPSNPGAPPQAWKDAGDSGAHEGQRVWIAEMYGYAYGAAKAGVWHSGFGKDFTLYPGELPAGGRAACVWAARRPRRGAARAAGPCPLRAWRGRAAARGGDMQRGQGALGPGGAC